MDTTDDTADVQDATTHKNTNAPSLLALQIMEKLLVEAIKSRQNVGLAEADLRTVRELRPKLLAAPTDPSLVSWLRQIAQRWSPQLRDRALRFRHLFDHLELAR
jgi:hypothetical protein